jgi:hypothetical protein
MPDALAAARLRPFAKLPYGTNVKKADFLSIYELPSSITLGPESQE